MSDLFGDSLEPILIGVSLIVFSVKFGYFFDLKLSEGIRNSVASQMKRVAKGEELVSVFIELFDRLFKTTHRGRPSVLRAIVASCLVLLTFIAVALVVWIDEPETAFTALAKERSWPAWTGIIAPICIWLGTNLIGDFLSLWETRVILGLMRNSKDWRVQVGLLVLDLVATVIVFCVGVLIGVCILFVAEVLQGQGISWDQAQKIMTALAETFNELILNNHLMFCGKRNSYDLISIYFYTSLSASVWAWIFFLGVRVWLPIGQQISKLLSVDRHPFGVAMTIGGVIVGGMVIVVLYILQIFGSICG